MREEGLEVSVTFDERHGYIGSDCGRPSWRSRSLSGKSRGVNEIKPNWEGIG